MSKFLDTAMQDLIASMDCRLNKLQAHVDEYNEIVAAKQRLIGVPKAPRKLVENGTATEKFLAAVKASPGLRVCDLIREHDLSADTYKLTAKLVEKGLVTKRGFLYFTH